MVKTTKKSAVTKTEKPKCKCSENLWVYITIGLGVLLIVAVILAIIGFSNNNTNKMISETEATDKVLSLLEMQGVEATLSKIEVESGMYKLTLVAQGQTGEIFITTDGKYLINGALPIADLEQYLNAPETTTEEPTLELQKSEEPTLEVFLSPYCPYGLQYIKALIPAYEQLNSKANISIQLLNPTHMQEELPEIKQELCIVEEYGQKELFAYLKEIVFSPEGAECYNVYHGINLMTNEPIESEYKGNGAYFNECMAPIINNALEKVNLDKTKLNECIITKSDALLAEANTYSQTLKIQSSPTPILNGISLKTNRTPEAIKDGVCDAFLEAPEICNTELPNEALTPGIGDKTSTGSTVGVC